SPARSRSSSSTNNTLYSAATPFHARVQVRVRVVCFYPSAGKRLYLISVYPLSLTPGYRILAVHLGQVGLPVVRVELDQLVIARLRRILIGLLQDGVHFFGVFGEHQLRPRFLVQLLERR